jgi:hypothetical protein
MLRRLVPAVFATVLGVGLWAGLPSGARAQYAQPQGNQSLNHFFYYPYYYFPHNYWPILTPKWPEPALGASYMKPPAYMAYPPFMEAHWRYEWYMPQRYYRGFHFWLDQF